MITSPWFAVADMVAALAAEYCQAVFLHVPQNYVMGAHMHRRRWITNLMAADRYFCIAGLPAGRQGFSCVWLCKTYCPFIFFLLHGDSAIATDLIQKHPTLAHPETSLHTNRPNQTIRNCY